MRVGNPGGQGETCGLRSGRRNGATEGKRDRSPYHNADSCGGALYRSSLGVINRGKASGGTSRVETTLSHQLKKRVPFPSREIQKRPNGKRTGAQGRVDALVGGKSSGLGENSKPGAKSANLRAGVGSAGGELEGSLNPKTGPTCETQKRGEMNPSRKKPKIPLVTVSRNLNPFR